MKVSLSIYRALRIGLTLVLIDPKWWKHSEMDNRESQLNHWMCNLKSLPTLGLCYICEIVRTDGLCHLEVIWGPSALLPSESTILSTQSTLLPLPPLRHLPLPKTSNST